MAKKKRHSEDPFAILKRRPSGDPFQWLRDLAIEEYDKKKSLVSNSGNFDWFAADRIGHVAILDGRENGLVPQDVFVPPKEDYLKLFEHFARATEVEFKGDYPTGYAAQGLFLYEVADLAHDGYERIAAPDHPLSISDCSPEIAKILAFVRFDGAFSESPLIWAERKWKCNGAVPIRWWQFWR